MMVFVLSTNKSKQISMLLASNSTGANTTCTTLLRDKTTPAVYDVAAFTVVFIVRGGTAILSIILFVLCLFFAKTPHMRARLFVPYTLLASKILFNGIYIMEALPYDLLYIFYYFKSKGSCVISSVADLVRCFFVNYSVLPLLCVALLGIFLLYVYFQIRRAYNTSKVQSVKEGRTQVIRTKKYAVFFWKVLSSTAFLLHYSTIGSCALLYITK
jgi:hypothetical protein